MNKLLKLMCYVLCTLYLINLSSVYSNGIDYLQQASLSLVASQSSYSNLNATAQSSGNLVVNGSFENTVSSEWAANTCSFTRTSQQSHSGTYSAKITNAVATYSSIRQKIDVMNNAEYYYSVWVKLPAGAPQTMFTIIRILMNGSIESGYANIASGSVQANSWTRISGRFVQLGSDGESSTIKIYVTGSGASDYYIDDFAVEQERIAAAIISGIDKFRIPVSGAITTKKYNIEAKNQIGEVINTAGISLSVVNNASGLPINGVSIDNKGNLSVSGSVSPCVLKLTATATYAGTTVASEKLITLLEYADEMSVVSVGMNQLTSSSISSESLNGITQNLTLPTVTANGCTVSWFSTNPNVVSNAGIVYPSVNSDIDVRLIASVTFGHETGYKNFDLTVRYKRNLIQNGGFEDAVSSEWIKNSCSAVNTQEQVHSGTYSAKIINRTQYYGSIRQNVTVYNNIPYEYSVWIRLPEGTPTQEFRISRDPIYDSISKPTAVTSTEWTELKGSFTVVGADGGTANFDVFAYNVSSTNFAPIIYMDDWCITPLTESSIYDYVLYDGTERINDVLVGNVELNTYIFSPKIDTAMSVVMAVYDGNELKGISLVNNIIPAGTAKNIHNSIYRPSDSYELKIFAFDSMKKIMPIRSVKKFKQPYYVSKSGSDSNVGSFDKPFLTISKAAQIMLPGDTCVVREGVYRETVTPNMSGTQDNPIVYTAYPNENVTISGADVLNANWQQHSAGIYKTDYSAAATQVFVDGQQYNIARWPNAPVDDLFNSRNYAFTLEGDYGYIKPKDLPIGDWNGATVHIWPGSAWYGYDKAVTYDSGQNRLNFTTPFLPANNGYDTSDYRKPKTNNMFYIYGKLAGLDMPTEWVQEDNKIYLWNENGTSPSNNLIEIKKRDWAFNISNKSYIQIKGFNIFGAAIDARYADNNIIDNCTFKYISDYINENNTSELKKSILVQGNNNVIKNCDISFAVGDGIKLSGNYNTVQNCIIHDINSFGSYYGAISTSGIGNKILNNSMYNSGRFLVQIGSSEKLIIKYNEMYNGGYLTEDLGATYCWGVNGKGSEISYNWVHDMNGERGIYLDNFCSNFNVHHNVIYNVGRAITLNSDSLNNLVYNNTMKNTKYAFDTFAYLGYTLTQLGTKIKNNITCGTSTFATGATAPEVSKNVTSELNADFLPIAGSPAIDGGIIIDGFTNGFVGTAPDIGAYEVGGKYWVPGAYLKVKN